MSEIIKNPLQGLVAPSPKRKRVPRPKWMCKHKEAALIDRENCVYRCIQCNPTSGTITIIPNVSTKGSPKGSPKETPKKVTVSPTNGIDESPKGFS
jgi:hypothetical protein